MLDTTLLLMLEVTSAETSRLELSPLVDAVVPTFLDAIPPKADLDVKRLIGLTGVKSDAEGLVPALPLELSLGLGADETRLLNRLDEIVWVTDVRAFGGPSFMLMSTLLFGIPVGSRLGF